MDTRLKGDFTLPGEAGYEKLTLELAEKWGADVIRDSDGTKLSPEIAEAGYRPGVYAYRYLAYFSYDLPRLSSAALWAGALGASSDFYYAHEFWQNAVAEGIRGISGAVDRDFWFEKLDMGTDTDTDDAAAA